MCKSTFTHIYYLKDLARTEHSHRLTRFLLSVVSILSVPLYWGVWFYGCINGISLPIKANFKVIKALVLYVYEKDDISVMKMDDVTKSI